MFKIIGTYQGKSEVLEDEVATLGTAEYLRGEYQMAFGQEWAVAIEECKEDLDVGGVNSG